jgi:hypothetical protein
MEYGLVEQNTIDYLTHKTRFYRISHRTRENMLYIREPKAYQTAHPKSFVLESRPYSQVNTL